MYSPVHGYYSIVQYCPDPSRLEAVNVGVALFCPELRFLCARFGKRKTPVQGVFGKQDWGFVEAQTVSLEARLSRREEEFQDLSSFESFIAKRAGALRLTPARPIKVQQQPEQELNDLFRRLVGSQRESRKNVDRLISSELRSIFHTAGVDQRLKANITVHPP